MGLKDSLKDSMILLVGATVVVLGCYSDLNKEVSLNVDGQEYKYNTFSKNVTEFLHNKKIDVNEWSKIDPPMDAEIKDDMKITIDNRFSINIKDGKKEKEYLVNQGTLENTLESCNISLGEKDILNKELDEHVKPDETIEIVRIVEKEEVALEDISYNVSSIKDSNLLKGNTKIVSKGQSGQKEVKYRVTYKDGTKILKEKLSENIIKEPIDEVVKIGTLEAETI
ncbi:DUF348 domain-containing protein [Romboutsia weinsteinii]|uniref:DUF348 domain-containing protein n=1 Tax=Romboutsia weinsteinii TaxID=2020949 RepID=A0A371J1W0_9FIRM|nr:G5 domain-containing protein [Romboutsia weinsteinii]RDY26673.1 DUF348 domain-containing protein [Romboutsia weinsteinii]